MAPSILITGDAANSNGNADMQKLELDEAFYPRVLEGSITATIRIGDRPIVPGSMMFLAAHGGYLPLIVGVDYVIKTTWLGISDYDAQLAGYSDGDVARDAMMELYPETKPDTPFTIIRFTRGA